MNFQGPFTIFTQDKKKTVLTAAVNINRQISWSDVKQILKKKKKKPPKEYLGKNQSGTLMETIFGQMITHKRF